MITMIPISVWLKYLPAILSGISWVALFCVGYGLGSSHMNDKWTIKRQNELIEYQSEISVLVSQVRKQERDYRDKIDEIVSEGMKKEETIKNEYEKIINDLRDNTVVLGGVYDCDKSRESGTGVSATKQHPANLVCYPKAELYRKLERSLAITNECDKLAVRYNSLLEVCQKNVEANRNIQ